MSVEMNYHRISQFTKKIIKRIISKNKIFYENHKNYYLKKWKSHLSSVPQQYRKN